MNGSSGSISVDGKVHEYETTGSSGHLDLHTSLHIGGVDSRQTLPRAIWSAMLRYGYVGCMQDVSLNGERVDLAALARVQEVEGISEYCSVMPVQCRTKPCMHRGVCQEGWNRYVCDCSATGYIGPSCNEGE